MQTSTDMYSPLSKMQATVEDDRKKPPPAPAVVVGGSSWPCSTSHNSSETTMTSSMASSSYTPHQRNQYYLSSSRSVTDGSAQHHLPPVFFNDHHEQERLHPKKKKKKKKNSSNREQEESGRGEKKKKKKKKSSKRTDPLGAASLANSIADSNGQSCFHNSGNFGATNKEEWWETPNTSAPLEGSGKRQANTSFAAQQYHRASPVHPRQMQPVTLSPYSRGSRDNTLSREDIINEQIQAHRKIISDLQSYTDDRKSSATTRDNPTQEGTSNQQLDRSFASHSTPSSHQLPFSNGDPDEVPPELLVNYMIAMGAKRDEADKLANSFTAEQMEQQQPHRGRHVRPANMTLSNKLKEAEQRGAPRRLPSVGTNSGDGRSVASYSIYGQQSTVPSANQQNQNGRIGMSSFAKNCNPLNLAEAMPVEGIQGKDAMINSSLPIVYADTTPISFKHLVNERPVRRLICIGAIVAIGVVIAIVAYFTAIKESPVPKSALETNFPSMSPSMAPTFISDDILSAAGALSGINSLTDTSSPQFKAVGWMSSFDQIEMGALDSHKFAQRYALVVMYYSFVGEDWINQEQWLRSDLHECEWSSGIPCKYNGGTGTGVVTGFDATRNNLHGTIPPEVGLLSSIDSFQIPKNRVSGSIPSEFYQITSLSVVDMSDNVITGPVPATIDDARDLIRLDLANNQLNSTLPDSIYQLRLLRTLILRSNKIAGTLSDDIGNMKALVTLDMRNNQISGSLPLALMSSLPSLDILQLDYNQLSGFLPTVTNSVSRTQTISLSHNQLEGNINVAADFDVSASSFADILVQYIDLSYNQLTGTINPILGLLPTLRHLDLSGNAFVGQFPSFLPLRSIEYLASASNLHTGTIPVGSWSTLSK